MLRTSARAAALMLLFVATSFGFVEPVTQSANSDANYQALRHIGLSGEAANVSNLVLKRDAGTFTFSSGTFYFVTPVASKVTGAVFVGDGTFSLTPPTSTEKHMLALLTRESAAAQMTEQFSTVVLRFTDDSYQEIKSTSTPGSGSANAASALEDSHNACRHKLHDNLDARILADVLSPERGGLFVAFINGKKYDSKMLFTVDPRGADEVAPEEVSLRTYGDTKNGIWAAFHLASEYTSGAVNANEKNHFIHLDTSKLDTTIEKNANLRGRAETTVVALSGGIRMIPFTLYPTLRVQGVTDAAGVPLAFIQEDKKDDPDFWVILPQPLTAGQKFTVKTSYEGKEAVSSEGGGNYYPVTRDGWYPNTAFGDYSNYEMTFRIPKNLKMVASGALVSEANENGQNVTVWKSEAPQTVAGFNFGDFKEFEIKLKDGFDVLSFANKEPPDIIKSLQRRAEGDSIIGGMDRTHSSGVVLGSMDTTLLMKKPLAEAELAVGLYTTYFGPTPYKRLAMTQQTACNFGQSWPEMVYLPICSYFDSTVRHQLGLDDTRGYWKTVAPHEVAHQWWGHTVGFNSYRDQWMSEGFSEFSASLFIQMIQKNPQEFIRFWNDERDLLTERNAEGFSAINAGSLVNGYRLANTRTGYNIPRRLIYPKGGYILHMIRMMMWDRQKGDAAFIEMMHDFVQTYTNKAATTEDFKAMVEKHMLSFMDLNHDGKMDWFFNEYVYGTGLPRYELQSSFAPDANGTTLSIKVTQSNVYDGFMMRVPIYIELADGRVVRLGSVALRGNNSMEQQIPLAGLKDPPKRAMLNYYDDVLASPN